jgi:myosin-heavy-chain kinase
MTELVSSFHSASSLSTAYSRIATTDSAVAADERNCSGPVSSSAAGRVMGSSPLQLREEAAAAAHHSQCRAEQMTGKSNSAGAATTPAGPSPSLSNSKLESDRRSFRGEGRQRRRQSSPPSSNSRTPLRDRYGSCNSSIHSKDSTAPERAAGGGLPLLPLIPSAAGVAKEASLLDLQSTPQQPLVPNMSSPSLSPSYSARQQRRQSLDSARDMVAHAAVNSSCGSFTLSPTRSTRDISATGLRGPIPENVPSATSLPSPMSQGRNAASVRPTPTSTASGHPTSGAAGAATVATAAGSSGVADGAVLASGEAIPLPLLTRSLVSISNSQSRRLTGTLLDASVNAAVVAAAASAAAMTSRSSSMNSMRRDDEGPQQAASAAVGVEWAPAVSQPPLPPPPPLASSSVVSVVVAPSPPPLASKYNAFENSFRTFAPRGASSGLDDFDDVSRQLTSRLGEDEDESETTAANLQNAPLCPADAAEEVTITMAPMLPTDVGVHAAPPSVTTVAPTNVLGYSDSSLPVPEVRAAASATRSAVASSVFTPTSGGSEVVHDTAARRSSGSIILKDGSGDQQDSSVAAAATAARGATEARRPSDSVTEAVDPKAAKRRLKKEKKGKKAKHHEPPQGAADNSNHDNHGSNAAAIVAAAPAHCSDSEMERKRQRKKQEKQEMLKGMSTEERRQHKADHQRRRAAKKARRSSTGAPPALKVDGIAATTQADTPPHPTLSSSPVPTNLPDAAKAPADSVVNGDRDVELSVDPLGDTQPPISRTPESPSLETNDNRDDKNRGGSDKPPSTTTTTTLGLTQSTPQLSSSARGPDDDLAGGATLLHVLNQMRRCTSAKGPSTPVAALSATPPHDSDGTPRHFRRRFLSEAAPASTPQYRTNGFLCLPTTDMTREPHPPQQEDLTADSPRGGERDADVAARESNGSFDGEGHSLADQPQYGSSTTATGASMRESVVTSAAAAPFIVPHRPAAAAGSGAAAILELKQQQQHHREDQQPPPSLTAHNILEGSVAGDRNNDRDCLAEEAAVVLMAMGQPSVRVSVASSGESPFAGLPVARTGPETVLEEASNSSNKESGGTVGSRSRRVEEGRQQVPLPPQQPPPQPPQQRSDTKEAASPSSLSYYSSYSRSHYSRSDHRSRDHHHRNHHRNGRLDGGDARVNGDAADKKKQFAQQGNGDQHRRSSRASSCSSLHSRSGDDESDVAGSSSYSYSYSSSTGSSSSSSSSSSTGSVMAEVLPLKEGCTTAPPNAAFHDLKYRYSCVPQLQGYAEMAVIHEWNLTEGCWGSVETSVVLNPQPFSKGNMRASYYMIDMRRLNCMLVAKRYLKSSVGEDQYFDDVSMHSISGHWARVFNAMHPPKKVRFVPAAVLVLPKRNPPLVLAMEPLLTGKFVKYNNNCGYVRRNARWTPQAFSHFTYQASNHELMVVDIQGVDDYYTDPQILSPDGKGYGRGNLGKKGIRRFLESHKCNDVCRAVGLPPLQRNSKGAVIAPLMSAKNANGGSLPTTPCALERLAAASSSGLKDERLPPKIYSVSPSQQQSLPGNMHSGEGSSLLSSGASAAGGGTAGNNNSGAAGVHTRGSSLAEAPRAGCEAAKLGSPPPPPPRHSANSNNNTHCSGTPPPSSAPAVKGGRSGYGSSDSPVLSRTSNNPNQNGSGGNGMMVGAPAAGYGVKYVPYPRYAVVRPQSQYFTSTVAGGLMAVPPSTNGPGSLSTPSSPALHSPSTAPGYPNTGGGVGAAVPLLRPPAMGRPGGSSGGGGGGNGGCGGSSYLANPSSSDAFTNVSPQRTASSQVVANTPQRPKSAVHPHPPPKSRLSSLGAGVSLGTPKPPSLSGGAQNVSHTNSSVAIIPVVQSATEVQMVGGAHGRRQSFSRRPVFTAVEEIAKSKPKRRHHQ